MKEDLTAARSAIGPRLEFARRTAGLSTRAVAQRLLAAGTSISHATLRRYERGMSVPELRVVQALAHIYDRPVEWIRGQGAVMSGVRYRCLKAVRETEKRQYEGEACGWFVAYTAAEDILGDKEDSRPITLRPNESAESAARRVREDHKLGDYPIPSVCRLLENYGIRVIQLSTDSRIDGLAGWFGGSPVVVVTPHLSSDRMRMNLAHELGHHFLHSAGSISDDAHEAWAFEFASHLLIPDVWLQKAFELMSMVRLVQYKERFGISLAAMIFRARRQSLISNKLYERLWRDFARLGWRRNEPGYVQPDRPLRMEVLFDAAIRQRKMSLAKISQLAGVDPEDVESRILSAVGATPHTSFSSERGIIKFETHRHEDTK